MRPNELESQIVNWTVMNSGFDLRRPYIGLSGIYDCPALIYERYFNGYERLSVDEHLKTRMAYDLEAVLQARLMQLGVYSEGETIRLHDGLVQGHTDGVIDGRDLLEIKTVSINEHLPPNKRIPKRVFWQVQAYLHYTKRRYAQIVYLARASGLVMVLGLKYREDIGGRIERKVDRLVEAVRNVRRPACECGRCDRKVVER